MITELYNVPRESMIQLIDELEIPIGSKFLNKGDIIKFHNLDGMYSYCTDLDGNPVHLAAWSKVKIIKNAG